MNVLLTGAFGNIGAATLRELLARGHQVRCFDVRTKQNARVARQWSDKVDILWGDLRRPEDVQRAVQGQTVVVHLAFVIPKLSATGIGSEERPEWARSINVGGTMNLLAAMKSQEPAPKLLFASSLHVFGPTQDQPPPRRLSDPVRPVENYALHKVACEEMVKASGLDWTIFRLAAAMPIRLILDTGVFDVPLNNRIEYVHSKDVARAIANALETREVWGDTWLIGGGARCQYFYGDLAARVLDAMGVGMLPAQAFSTTPFSTDWLDTSESQRLLQFQQHTLDDYVSDMRRVLGWRRPFITVLRPFVRAWLLRQSPYYHRVKSRSAPLRPEPGPAL